MHPGFALGFGFGARAAQGPTTPAPFTPAKLNLSAWYDPGDLSTLFADSAGTTPAELDGPVGLMRDKSGNNRHCSQATADSRPLLKQDGSGYYLQFDGVDDFLTGPALSAIITVSQSDIWVAGSIETLTSDQGAGGSPWVNDVFFADGGDFINLYTRSTGPVAGAYQYSGGNDVAETAYSAGENCILRRSHAGGVLSLAKNGGAAATDESAGDIGALVTMRFGRGGSNTYSDLRLRGFMARPTLLDSGEAANALAWLAARGGVSLS